MTAHASLRTRVLLGAALWTIGLLALSILALTFHAEAWVVLRALHSHTPFAFLIAVVSMLGGLAVVAGGLKSITVLRARLSDVRAGRDDELRGAYPAEVQPLVDDLNALIRHNQRAVARASAKAGDMAHGLKTPLAVLAQEADRAEREGQRELAGCISQQVERMRRQIEYHLAHARAAASGATPGARCVVAESAEALVRTLERLYAAKAVAIGIDVPGGLVVRVQREDLDEMLGNLLDNACKWARTRVRVSSAPAADRVTIVVEDDGPGLDVSMRDSVLQRGVRADEAAPGSGLGLAIVRDLAELYSGTIALESSSLGGLSARLELPGA